MEWTSNVHVFREPELTAFRLADGFTVWGAATTGRPTPRASSTMASALLVVHLALFHGAERGTLHFQEEGKIAHAPFDEEQIAAAGLAHAFAGHYHQPRDTDLLTYPGNLERLAFGETGDRGLVIATVAADGLVTTQRDVLARVGMYDVDVDADGCGTVDEVRARLKTRLVELPQGAPVRAARVTVTGQAAGPLHMSREDLLTVSDGLDKLVVQRLELQAADGLEQIAAEPTVRGAFVRMVRENAQLTRTTGSWC